MGGASYLAGCSVIALCVWEMRRGLVGYVRLGVDQTITESNPIQSMYAIRGKSTVRSGYTLPVQMLVIHVGQYQKPGGIDVSPTHVM